MIQNINIDNSNVSAELHALMYDYVYGFNGVYDFGQKFEYEIVSNNEIKIKDGLLISQGRLMRIVTGSYESISIENGQSDINRCDLIVAHFETDGIQETFDIRVIKGISEQEPDHITGDTFNGDTINELPLYAVHLTGLNITSVDKKFELINSEKGFVDFILEKMTSIKTDGNVQNELLLSSSRSEPTNKLLVQMKDANGKVVYIEADASNTYLASGETVENCLSRAVFLQPLE